MATAMVQAFLWASAKAAAADRLAFSKPMGGP
jgi:hypothetical protein